MSFYVVSVKDRIQESTGNIMYPPYCYQAFSDEIETLRATDLKRIWVLSTKIMTLCSHYTGERSAPTPLRKQLKIVISV
jgi:hypothetical protein